MSAKLKKQQEWEGLCLGERDVIWCGGKLVKRTVRNAGLIMKNTKKVYHLNESVKMQDSQPRDAVQKDREGSGRSEA